MLKKIMAMLGYVKKTSDLFYDNKPPKSLLIARAQVCDEHAANLMSDADRAGSRMRKHLAEAESARAMAMKYREAAASIKAD